MTVTDRYNRYKVSKLTLLASMLTYIYSLCNAAVQPCHITALRGLSSCTGPTLFQSRVKACSDRATPSYRRFDTLAKSPAPPLDRAVRAAASRLVTVA